MRLSHRVHTHSQIRAALATHMHHAIPMILKDLTPFDEDTPMDQAGLLGTNFEPVLSTRQRDRKKIQENIALNCALKRREHELEVDAAADRITQGLCDMILGEGEGQDPDHTLDDAEFEALCTELSENVLDRQIQATQAAAAQTECLRGMGT
ncbi:hypothetical protein KIPB_009864 [Kipferlia bialata]|uniref:Uncharacterized protein n=1 Tax=Kipferlia bialata TaxID=797122 RepID=A0A9K3GLY5_9EUKA|nr:hypothetical protein KIPB_009864 [Kipferlia bialata]|eukprot:g9864.t1